MACPSVAQWGAIAQLASPIVGWALVIAGWYWVSRDHNARERRKELRATVTELAKQIADVEREAHSYVNATGGGTPEARAYETRIKAALQRLGQGIERLHNAESIDVRREFVEYRKAITLGDFERVTRVQGEPHNWPFEISQAANELIDACEQRFRAKHP